MKEKENTNNKSNLHPLPKGWIWTKLENCIDILDSQRIPVNAKERRRRIAGKPISELYPYYGATGQVGWIDDYLFDEELILLGEDGAPFFELTKNKAYIVRGKSWVNNHAHILRALAELTTNSFLCHYLNIFDYNGYVTGTTRPKLNQSRMREFPIPLPPLPEQHRIVAKIEELFTRLDAGVEALKKAKEQLRWYRQSVLKAAMEGRLTEEWRKQHKDELEPASMLLEKIKEERKKKLGKKYKELPPVDTKELPELPEGWEWVRLSELTFLVGDGLHGTPEYTPGTDCYFINGNNLNDGKIEIKPSTKTVSYDEMIKYKKDLSQNTVFVSINGTLGKVAFYNGEKIVLGKSVCYFNLIEGFSKHFMKIILESPFFMSYAISNATGSTIKNLSLKAMNEFPVPVPSNNEQNIIVSEVERYLSIAEAIEKTVEQGLKQAERLRQSILKRAFEGNLVPQNPDDEPASVLLERIKEEKAKRQNKKYQTRLVKHVK